MLNTFYWTKDTKFQSLPASQAERTCINWALLAPDRGPRETACTPKTWPAGFLLASDTVGD